MDIDEDGEKWKKEFAREVKKLKADIKKDVTGKSNTELIAMGDLGGDEDGEVGEKGVVVAGEGEGKAKVEGEKEEDEEVRYSDIISPEFGTFVVVCFLIGGTPFFLGFFFCKPARPPTNPPTYLLTYPPTIPTNVNPAFDL